VEALSNLMGAKNLRNRRKPGETNKSRQSQGKAGKGGGARARRGEEKLKGGTLSFEEVNQGGRGGLTRQPLPSRFGLL
jgi:hypothetical protein